MEYVILSIILVAAGLGLVVFINSLHNRRLASMSAVNAGVEYPNNHHVLGVGYYHAASQRWFPQPWNEYREGRGYYWNGNWNSTPDQRMVLKSTPPLAE